jgi:hypothetical protein
MSGDEHVSVEQTDYKCVTKASFAECLAMFHKTVTQRPIVEEDTYRHNDGRYCNRRVTSNTGHNGPQNRQKYHRHLHAVSEVPGCLHILSERIRVLFGFNAVKRCCSSWLLLQLVCPVFLPRVLGKERQLANPRDERMTFEAEGLVVAEVLLLCAAIDGECSCTCRR